jgi:hypothetical protein
MAGRESCPEKTGGGESRSSPLSSTSGRLVRITTCEGHMSTQTVKFVLEESFPLSISESVYHLWKFFLFMERNGTPDAPAFLARFFPGDQSEDLERNVNAGLLTATVETLKLECLRNHVALSNTVLAEICAGSVKWGEALPASRRQVLSTITDELHAHQLRAIVAEESAQDVTPNTANTGKVKGKKINARILALLSADINCHDWTAIQFANRLDCGDGTVKGTPAWKQIMKYRAVQAADRISRTGALNGGKRKPMHTSKA